MRQRPVLDVSALPTFAFGPRSPTWWGTLGFMALEGMGFALAAGAYLYLAELNPDWPLSSRPAGSLARHDRLTALLLLSLLPNHHARPARQAMRHMRPVRLWLVSHVAGRRRAAGRSRVRVPALKILWDATPTARSLWILLGLHTTHLLTDLGDTLVLTALMFTRHGSAAGASATSTTTPSTGTSSSSLAADLAPDLLVPRL